MLYDLGMVQDRPALGVALMIVFCACAPFADSMAKILGATLPLLQILLICFAVQAALLAPVVLRGAKDLRMQGRILLLLIARTILHFIGIGAMFAALRYLPLADAVAISFVLPFIMLLLGKAFLGEEVGGGRLAACCVGFVGTLMVVQPSFMAVGAAAFLPLVVAVAFAFFILITRVIAKEIEPVTLQFISGAMAVPMLGVALLVFYGAHPDIRIAAPGGREWALLLGIGALGTFAHLAMTWSLRFAPSATLAPVQYLEIPFATMIGWLIFGDLPNGLAALGILVTVAAGLFVVRAESRRARRVAPPTA